MIGQYSFGEFVCNIFYYIYTRAFFPSARLVRLPFYLRGGRAHFAYGEGFTAGYGCRFDLGGDGITLTLGKNCKINDRVHIVAHEAVTIGNDVLMASNIFISDTSHGSYGEKGEGPNIAPDSRRLSTSPVSIGNRVWIGEGARIMPGVVLGDGCVVGANAVVTHSFPNASIIAGVPAKRIKVWNDKTNQWEAV